MCTTFEEYMDNCVKLKEIDQYFIESTGMSVSTASDKVKSELINLIRHLMMVKYSPATTIHNHWRSEIKTFRNNAKKIMNYGSKKNRWTNVINNIIDNWNDIYSKAVIDYAKSIKNEPDAKLPNIRKILPDNNPWNLDDIMTFNDSKEYLKSEIDTLISVLPDLE